MKTPHLRRGRGTPTVGVPEQPTNEPEPVPAQSQPERRTTRQERRASKRTEKRDRHNAKVIRHRAARRKFRQKIENKLREKASEPAMTPDARAGLMGISRRGALVAITLLDLAATGVSFGESWDALYQWALHHGLNGFWAFVFPLQIDTFIAMGELALFIAIIDHWHWKSRVWAWISTFGGLAVSMVGNVGHVSDHSNSWQATAAVPPLAAMAGMFIGFQVLKRVMNPTQQAVADQETQELISQLRQQVEANARRVPAPRRPEPVRVPQPRPASEPATVTDPNTPSGNWLSTVEDIWKEGQQTPPTPRTSMGQDKPGIVRERPRARNGRHARWDDAVKFYRESLVEVERGERIKPLSQRELAAKLGMQNRSLARRVIDYVDNSGE